MANDSEVFEYYMEDLDCLCCLYRTRKRKLHKNGCVYEVCPFLDIQSDAISNGRYEREHGSFKCRD
jgi:hypothetical protein